MILVSTHRWQCSMAVCVFVLDRKKGNIDKAKIFCFGNSAPPLVLDG